MFKYWERVDTLSHLNRLLLAFTGILSIVVLALIFAIASMPNRYEFWLSPSMSVNGGIIKPEQVSAEYIQGFVSTLLPSLNTWSKSGEAEFRQSLGAFHYYFTPRHIDLMNQKQEAYQNAQLFNRTQIASLYRFMESGDVRPLATNAWEVHLVLRITQRLNNDSNLIIADKVVDYYLRVVKVNTSRLQNPFQLALDGYTRPESLQKDLLAENPSGDNV